MKPQLAHINIAKFVLPANHQQNAEFMAGIEYINGLAERSEGFVWRLKDGSEDGIFGDEKIVATVSVWESVEALKAFSYHSDHVNFFRKRANWFERLDKANYALWWIKNKNFPTALAAKEKLEYLWANGSSEAVFDFKYIVYH